MSNQSERSERVETFQIEHEEFSMELRRTIVTTYPRKIDIGSTMEVDDSPAADLVRKGAQLMSAYQQDYAPPPEVHDHFEVTIKPHNNGPEQHLLLSEAMTDQLLSTISTMRSRDLGSPIMGPRIGCFGRH